MEKQRNLTIDIAKAGAVLMMIVGHCIQFGNGTDFVDLELSKTNVVYHYIYSYHMPLFAVISGYLFWFSVKKRNLIQIISNRVTGLVIPIIAWQLCINLFNAALNTIANGVFDFKQVIIGFLSIFSNMWFLWSILICSLLVAFLYYVLKNKWWGYLIVEVLTLLMPKYIGQLWLWLFPYFSGAFLFAEYKETIIKRKHINIIIISIVLHICLVAFWKQDYYIYKSGAGRNLLLNDNPIWYVIYCNLYRLLSGVSGCIACIAIISRITKFSKKITCFHVGIYMVARYSIGIYVISVYMLNTFLRIATFFNYNIWMNLLQSVIILVLSVCICWVIEKIKIARMLLLGIK